MKIKLFSAFMTIVALISLSINIRQYTEIKDLRSRPGLYETDRPFVQKAWIYYSQKGGTTVQKAMEGRYANAMFINGRVCISLELTGGVGGTPVYCFNEKSGALVERYDDVE